MLHFYKATVIRVIDGDTVVLSIDNGFHSRYETSVRLLGFDAPEVRTRDLEEKGRGLLAKQRLEELIYSEGYDIYIRTEKSDSFGRWLGIIYLDIDKYVCVNDIMKAYCEELETPLPSTESEVPI